jgi:membrane protease YdiL (CAAX protease family)
VICLNKNNLFTKIILFYLSIFALIKTVQLLKIRKVFGIENYLVYSFLLYFSFLLLCITYITITNFSYSVFAKGKTEFKNIFVLLLIGLSLQFLGGILGNIVRIITNKDIVREVVPTLTQYPFYLVFLDTCVIAPFVEETIFRGIIFGELLKITNPKTAIIISGIMFGAFHMNWTQFSYATLLGIVYSYIVYISKSVYPTIFLHMFANSTGVFAMYLINYFNKVKGYSLNNTSRITLSMIIIVILIFTPIFIFGLLNLKKQVEA